ncbi:hypothetical protein AAMO2058_001685800 [Amorphochlora amoebiformis]
MASQQANLTTKGLSFGDGSSLPNHFRSIAQPRNPVIWWVTSHSGSCQLCCYSLCQDTICGGVAIMPCFWPHLVVFCLGPVSMIQACTKASSYKKRGWILTDRELIEVDGKNVREMRLTQITAIENKPKKGHSPCVCCAGSMENLFVQGAGDTQFSIFGLNPNCDMRNRLNRQRDHKVNNFYNPAANHGNGLPVAAPVYGSPVGHVSGPNGHVSHVPIANPVITKQPGIEMVSPQYQSPSAKTYTTNDAAERLRQLENLMNEKLITPDEFTQRREKILNDLTVGERPENIADMPDAPAPLTDRELGERIWHLKSVCRSVMRKFIHNATQKRNRRNTRVERILRRVSRELSVLSVDSKISEDGGNAGKGKRTGLSQGADGRIGHDYRIFQEKGWTILAGKNGHDNDILTTTSKGDDHWFHAAGYPGSHVVVRSKDGKSLPPSVRKLAGGIAAWYSKAKTKSKVLIHWTRCKNVTKRKNSPPGQVMVRRYSAFSTGPINPIGRPSALSRL